MELHALLQLMYVSYLVNEILIYMAVTILQPMWQHYFKISSTSTYLSGLAEVFAEFDLSPPCLVLLQGSLKVSFGRKCTSLFLLNQ